MSALTTPASAAVTDEHVVVAASVVEPVVVTFDGLYVWSFSPRRDGTRGRNGWRVPWPTVMRDLLDGTTSVRLSDVGGAQVHFDGPVAFRGNTAALSFTLLNTPKVVAMYAVLAVNRSKKIARGSPPPPVSGAR